MNIAVIFAGGSGTRMNSKSVPKQFLLIHGKPIIVHTVELFEKHPDIEGIIVVCLKDWIPYMEDMVYRYRLSKVVKIVEGGGTGQLSIYNGLVAVEETYPGKNPIVLIHDGVRPLITEQTISDNIAAVKAHNSSITCAIAKETVMLVDNEGSVKDVPSREDSRLARAPQSFWLSDILDVHKRALDENIDSFIDSCTMMRYYGYPLHVIDGPYENIKITTPDDFFIFRALYDAKENHQIDF